MSKHSNSLRTISLLTQAPSFFDTTAFNDKFWRTMYLEEEDFSQYPKIIESDFFIREKRFFREWKSCTLTIRSSFLIYKKVKISVLVSYFPRVKKLFLLSMSILRRICIELRSSLLVTKSIHQNTHKASVFMQMGNL